MGTVTCTHEKGQVFIVSLGSIVRLIVLFHSSSFLSQGCRSFKRLVHSVLASFCTSIPPNGQVPFPRYSHHSERLWCLSRAISISTRPPTICRSCNGQSWVPIRPHLPEQCYRERF